MPGHGDRCEVARERDSWFGRAAERRIVIDDQIASHDDPSDGGDVSVGTPR